MNSSVDKKFKVVDELDIYFIESGADRFVKFLKIISKLNFR